MTIGSDKITNCDIVCNPNFDMKWSCDKYCEGYVFVVSTPPSTTADQFQQWWIIPVGLSVLFVVIIVACCCFKQTIRVFIQNCRGRRLTRHDDVERNAAQTNLNENLNENTSDSGISTDGQSMDTVVELEKRPENNEVTQTLLPKSTGHQQNQSIIQENDENDLTQRKQEGNKNCLAIGQEAGTKYVSKTGIRSN